MRIKLKREIRLPCPSPEEIVRKMFNSSTEEQLEDYRKLIKTVQDLLKTPYDFIEEQNKKDSNYFSLSQKATDIISGEVIPHLLYKLGVKTPCEQRQTYILLLREKINPHRVVVAYEMLKEQDPSFLQRNQ